MSPFQDESPRKKAKFGDPNEDFPTPLELSSHEAFFLAFGLGCLLVKNEEQEGHYNIDELWKIFTEFEADFKEKYSVYHHFRCKGVTGFSDFCYQIPYKFHQIFPLNLVTLPAASRPT